MLPNFQFYLIYKIFIFWFTALNWKKKTKLKCRNWFFDLLCNTVASILLWIEKEIFRSSFCGKISLFLYKQHRFMRTCGFDQIYLLWFIYTRWRFLLMVFLVFNRFILWMNLLLLSFALFHNIYQETKKTCLPLIDTFVSYGIDCICLVQAVIFGTWSFIIFFIIIFHLDAIDALFKRNLLNFERKEMKRKHHTVRTNETAKHTERI